jgi:hypothetical protein
MYFRYEKVDAQKHSSTLVSVGEEVPRGIVQVHTASTGSRAFSNLVPTTSEMEGSFY